MNKACHRARQGRSIVIVGLLALLGGCVSTAPQPGASKGPITGSAGGATAEGSSDAMERCDQSLGTLTLVEEQDAAWYQTLSQLKLGSTIPVLRLLIQQSNCFVVVERGRAMQKMMAERDLQGSGQTRADNEFGKGQMVSADYTMSPTITFNQNTGGAAGILGGASKKTALGKLLGKVKTNEASTMLIMIDNRSGIQLAAAEGSARKSDLDLGAALLGRFGGAGASSYTKSPEGKVILASFTDGYNQLVRAVRSYQAQVVKGGLGAGGTMGTQGGTTAASNEVDADASQPRDPAR